MIATYRQNIERALHWLTTMLVTPDGSQGIYERYRITLNVINPWVRPDCCIESARLFYAAGQREIGLNLAHYVCSLQAVEDGFLHGSFPFYVFRPRTPDERDIGDDFGVPNLPQRRWPNDNGKVTECILWFYQQTGGDLFLQAGRRALDYLTRTQASDGAFSLTEAGDEPNFKAADFVAWPTVALIRGAHMTGAEKYGEAAWRGLRWLHDHQHPSGRMLTGMETANFEPLRPVASETAMALHAFAHAVQIFNEPWVHDSLSKLADTLLAWQHESGGIRNADDASRHASLQGDPALTDLVYVDSYALLALQAAYRATGNGRYRQAAGQLADFLARVQCWGESPAWDGGWRGSYHLDAQRWHGSDQNVLEEGGMNTVYTGWSAAPIAFGLLHQPLMPESSIPSIK